MLDSSQDLLGSGPPSLIQPKDCLWSLCSWRPCPQRPAGKTTATFQGQRTWLIILTGGAWRQYCGLLSLWPRVQLLLKHHPSYGEVKSEARTRLVTYVLMKEF